MDLWTFQHPDLSLTHGEFKHDGSEFREIPGYEAICRELWTRLGVPAGNVMWCYTVEPERQWHRRTRWHLSVPETGIIACVDEFIWNRLLGIKDFAVPRSRWQGWRRDANMHFPHNPTARKRFLAQRVKEYRSEPEPEGGWWSCLLVPKVPGEGVSALVVHPVEVSWICVI